MSKTSLYAIVAVPAALAAGLGIDIAYEQSQRPALEIFVDEGGIKVNGNG